MLKHRQVMVDEGPLCNCGQRGCLEKIRAEVERYCMPSIYESVRIEKAALGDDSVLYGALSLIKNTDA